MDRINEMFGTDMEVYSVIDQYLESDVNEDNRDDTEKSVEQDTSE